jgi:hypothetical protein
MNRFCGAEEITSMRNGSDYMDRGFGTHWGVLIDELKILGDGEVTKKLNLVVTRISQSAKAKIEAVGGTVKVVAAKRTPKQRVADSKANS